MNRRSFFGFVCGGVAAAAAAPFVKPAAAEVPHLFLPYGSSLSCGAPAVGIVDFGQSLYVSDRWHMTARLSQSVFDGEISVDEANAAYWEELVEVEA